MGYRHQVMSDSMVPAVDKLPKWFVDKYERFIDFNHGFWVSYVEYKRYGVLKEFETDIQKALQEIKHSWGISIVFYADEGGTDQPDIRHVYITTDSITEKVADNWTDCPYAKLNYPN